MNPLYNTLGGNNNIMAQLEQFRSALKGDPQQILSEALRSGKVTQQQINQVMPMAQQIAQMFKR